jgi:hypothetical protein
MCVTCASPAVTSVALTLFYHSGRLPRSRLRLFRCATSPAMSLLWLTVVSHSRRRLRIPPPRHTRLCRRGSCICRSWGGFGFEGRGGLVDGLFGSGLLVGVCLFYMLYLFNLECVPMLLSVPASCHCDRCFCHSPRAVPAAYPRSRPSIVCCTSGCIRTPCARRAGVVEGHFSWLACFA